MAERDKQNKISRINGTNKKYKRNDWGRSRGKTRKKRKQMSGRNGNQEKNDIKRKEK